MKNCFSGKHDYLLNNKYVVDCVTPEINYDCMNVFLTFVVYIKKKNCCRIG